MRSVKQHTAICFFILALTIPVYGQIPPPPAAVLDPLPEILGLEYFFDTDPGYGNGIDVPITADSLISEDFDIDISGLSTGRHLVYFRVLDDNGRWTLIHVDEVNKASSIPAVVGPRPDILAMEYYFDNDPGHGNGIDVPITADSLISEDFDIDISGLDLGRHLVYFRVLDENGLWTLIHVNDINKASPIPAVVGPRPDIVAMEYYFDNDPGYGNGIDVPITADSLISEDFDIDISGLDLGRHLVYFRVLDENGRWTLICVKEINNAATSPAVAGPLPDIVAMEYFFDSDPGYGNGIDIPITADSLVDVDFILDISSWGTEMHMLYVRAMDEFGRWTLIYVSPVTKGDISRRMRHGKFFFGGIEQPMFTEDKPD